MGYQTSASRYVDAKAVNFTPAAAFAAAATTQGTGIELGENRVVTLTLTTSAVSASDTIDVTMQSSQDGTNWYTVGTFAQQAAATSETKTFVCGRWLRPQFVVAGSGIAITVSDLSGEAV